MQYILKDHYGWAELVCSRARYYTKTSQEGKSGLFCPTYCVYLLAHRQSEWSLNRQPIKVSDAVQSSDCRYSQTLQVESDQTLSTQFQKPPIQLNTPNRFVPELVRVSPNVSDVQRLGQCVPAFKNPLMALKTKATAYPAMTEWK